MECIQEEVLWEICITSSIIDLAKYLYYTYFNLIISTYPISKGQKGEAANISKGFSILLIGAAGPILKGFSISPMRAADPLSKGFLIAYMRVAAFILKGFSI